eukprot:gene12394-3641_t
MEAMLEDPHPEIVLAMGQLHHDLQHHTILARRVDTTPLRSPLQSITNEDFERLAHGIDCRRTELGQLQREEREHRQLLYQAEDCTRAEINDVVRDLQLRAE